MSAETWPPLGVGCRSQVRTGERGAPCLRGFKGEPATWALLSLCPSRSRRLLVGCWGAMAAGAGTALAALLGGVIYSREADDIIVRVLQTRKV